MVHVDGDDYTYDGICTADQHQAEQDAKIAWLQIFVASAQGTLDALIENQRDSEKDILVLKSQIRHLETLIHRLLNGNDDAAL